MFCCALGGFRLGALVVTLFPSTWAVSFDTFLRIDEPLPLPIVECVSSASVVAFPYCLSVRAALTARHSSATRARPFPRTLGRIARSILTVLRRCLHVRTALFVVLGALLFGDLVVCRWSLKQAPRLMHARPWMDP